MNDRYYYQLSSSLIWYKADGYVYIGLANQEDHSWSWLLLSRPTFRFSADPSLRFLAELAFSSVVKARRREHARIRK